MIIREMVTVAALFFVGTVAAAGDNVYRLDLSKGDFPKDVSMANVNGILPDVSGYKHGYTEDGWVAGRLDNRGYVALSPTWINSGTNSGQACCNILSLPLMEIAEGYEVSWDARSVYRHFPDSYRLEAIPEGESAVVLFTSEREKSTWCTHTVSLDAFVGRKVVLRFVCTSTQGYLLALDRVSVGLPDEDVTSGEEGGSEADNVGSGRFIVDHGTGTWCVNCPAAEISIDALCDKYGERVIMLNTHVRDILADESYWDALKWYSVPRMMLNRIAATAGSDTKKFADYLEAASANPEYEISILSASLSDAQVYPGKVDVSAKVTKISDLTDDSFFSDSYHVGYVLTGDFHDPANGALSQQNNCTLPAYGAYYYLPSLIPSALMYYEDVTLSPSDPAFSGLPESAYESLDDITWSLDIPETNVKPSALKIVAYVFDAVSGEIVAADASPVDGYVDIETIRNEQRVENHMTVNDGYVCLSLPEGENFRLEVRDAAGQLICVREGVSSGYDRLPMALTRGFHILTLRTPSVSSSLKYIL